MLLTYNVEKDKRFRLGKFKGQNSTNTAIVRFLIQYTLHSNTEIAKLVNVPEKFVKKVQKQREKEIGYWPKPEQFQFPDYLKMKVDHPAYLSIQESY